VKILPIALADNNAQKTSFKGQATNAFYKRLFNQTQSTETINRFAKFLKTIGDEFLVDTLESQGSTVSLTTVKSLPPLRYESSMAKDTVEALYTIENKSFGVNKALLQHYAQSAERKPFTISDKIIAAADIADLREDCRAIMKYQREHNVGYKKGEDLVFSWARVKRNLKINDINPNPIKNEIKLARELKADTELRAVKRAEYREEQNKSQPKTSTWNKIKKFFGS